MTEEKIKITQLPLQDSDIGEPNRCIIPIVNLDVMQTRKLSLESLLVYFEHLYKDSGNTGYIEVNCEGGLQFRDGVSYSRAKVISLGSTVNLTDIETKTLATSAITAANSVLSIAQSSYARANVAYVAANNAHNRANSAYDYADVVNGIAITANTIAKTANSRANDTYTVNGTRTNFVKKYEADALAYQLTISESSSSVTDKGLKLGDQGYLVCRNLESDDPPTYDTASIQLLSNYGIGFGRSSTGGGSILNKKNAMWIDTKNGDVSIQKDLSLVDGNISTVKTSNIGQLSIYGKNSARIKLGALNDDGTLNNAIYFTKGKNDGTNSFWILADRDGDGTWETDLPNNPAVMYFNITTQEALLFDRRIPAVNTKSSPGGSASGIVGSYGSDYYLFSLASISDERIKKIDTPITNATEKLLNLRTVYGEFTKKELKENPLDNGERIFLIAQDVEKEFPGIVYDSEEKLENGEPLKVMYYERLIPALVASIKELKQEIEELKRK